MKDQTKNQQAKDKQLVGLAYQERKTNLLVGQWLGLQRLSLPWNWV